MPLTKEQRDQIVNGLVGNCGCQGQKTPWADKDKAALNAMTDGELMTMDECRKAMGEFTKNARFSDAAGNRYKLDPTTNQLVLEQPAQSPAVNGASGQPTGQQVAQSGTQTDQAPVTNAGQSPLQVVIPPAQPMTAQEWIQRAPPELQATLNFAQQIEQQHRANLIGEIVANMSGTQREQTIAYLTPKPMSELLTIKNMMPPPAPAAPAPVTNWGGAFAPPAVSPVVNEDPLPGPKYDEVFKREPARSRA